MLSTRLKIGFASAFSCLALLLGLFASTGVASAHSAAHPHLNINGGEQVSATGRCVSVDITGTGFTPSHGDNHNHAQLDASDTQGDNLSIDPDSVRVDGDGNFDATVNICGLEEQFNQGTHCFSEFSPNGFFREFCPPTMLTFHSEIIVDASDEATGDSSEASFELSF